MGEDGTFCWGNCAGTDPGMRAGEGEETEAEADKWFWLLNKAVSGGGRVAGIGKPFFLKYFNKIIFKNWEF